MKSFAGSILITLIVSSFVSIPGQDTQTNNTVKSIEGDHSYDFTYKPGGEFERYILMHSRKGIRIEYNINQGQLNLWLSPQAGKTVDYRMRNFSCRDDHTSIFDKINFRELKDKRFIRCDYDPFHSVVYFEHQVMHLASLINQPVVLVWFEQEEVVDLKSDKQDSLLQQSPTLFGVRHPDRGLFFDFFATLGNGQARFQHQREVDRNRSIYARVVLKPYQVLILGGELSKENVKSIVENTAERSLQQLLDENESLISNETSAGSITLKNLNKDVQKCYNFNQRALLSMQDESGAIQAALRSVYYLIWATDGTVVSTSVCQSGDADILKKWLEFMLANPTSQKSPPEGKFFGQLVNGKITKREEFGNFCAVYSAFTYWGLTGDKRFLEDKYLSVLEEAVTWLERYCFDNNMNAIGTYYSGGGSEDPFYGSNDFGFDAAVGCFMDRNLYYPVYDTLPILRMYEYNTNLNQYNIYLMLSSATDGIKSRYYYDKAMNIKKFLSRLDSLNASAYYLVKDKGLVLIKRSTDNPEKGLFAIQNEAPAYFLPDFAKEYLNRNKSFVEYNKDSLTGKFCNTIYGHLAGLDIEFTDEAKIINSLEASLSYHINISRYNPMPYAMVEVFGAPEGTFHDIRPQAFTIGTYQSAITNLAVRTMPFGIAFRGTNFVENMRNFQYLGYKLDIDFTGSGKIKTITVNGKQLKNSYQLPSGMLENNNKIEITLSNEVEKVPELVYSTIRLNKVDNRKGIIQYSVTGYCQNVLIFKNLSGEMQINGSDGKPVKYTASKFDSYTFIEFSGKDDYLIKLNKS